MAKQCCECRSGEHDNYDEDVQAAVVIDPDTRKIVKRGNLCGEHRVMFQFDGYTVTEQK